MGKINEYQRKQLVSSAVGTAPVDRSGQVIGGAINQLGSTITAEARRRDTYDTIQANSAVMEFGLAFQRLSSAEQARMSANPAGYADKIMEDGTELVNTFSENIQDEGVREKFLESANTILRAGVFQAEKWAEQKKVLNVKASAEKSISMGTIMTGQANGVEQLKQSIATVKEMALTEVPPEIMSTKDAEEYISKNMGGVLDTYFVNQAYDNPEQLEQDLLAGKYDDVEYFTQEMKDKYVKAARARVKQVDSEVKAAQTENFGQLSLQFMEGNLSLAQVDAAWAARDTNPMQSITTGQKGRLYDGIIKRMDREAGKIKSAHPNAAQYIDLVYRTFDNRVDQAQALEKVIDVWADDEASPDELKFLSNLKANLQEVHTAQKADGWFKGVQTISNKVYRMWSDLKHGSSKEADYLRDLVLQAQTGIPAEVATKNVVDKMNRDKVLDDNPNLITYEDPVMASYEQQAYNQLKANGYKVDDKRVKALAEALRNADGRK